MSHWLASGSPPAAEEEPENEPTHRPANHPQAHEVMETSDDEQEVPLQEVTNRQIGSPDTSLQIPAYFACLHLKSWVHIWSSPQPTAGIHAGVYILQLN